MQRNDIQSKCVLTELPISKFILSKQILLGIIFTKIYSIEILLLKIWIHNSPKKGYKILSFVMEVLQFIFGNKVSML